ncbi:chaplin [Streptomyces sp. NPDC050560]|uniref:chaplin n=1 Tax=Streptomyces sp. NPDC050560 TaxID=3365630 RepID=UPI0037A5B730
MRQALSKGMLTAAAAATGILSLPGAHAFADAGAGAVTANSPGLLSGNAVQAPVHVPVNACGNTVDVVGLLNPAFGNNCANEDAPPPSHPAPPKPPEHHKPPKHHTPPPAPPREEPPAPPVHHPAPPVQQARTLPAPAALAETGGSPATAVAAALSGVLLLGGGLLYRRGRAAARG